MIEIIKHQVLQLAEQFKSNDLTLVTAESCTGGGLAYWITSVPGSSAWLERGFVTYSQAAKQQLLGVKIETLKNFGSVSEETAREMAEGALKQSEADISIAITGIAGPDGGSVNKPVGTVWFGLAKRDFQTTAWVEIFSGDRQAIRLQAISRALKEVLNV
jgi:nicotinamide-nucleotide amidase